MQSAGRISRKYRALLTVHYLSGVHARVNHKGGHSGHILSVDDGPVDWGGTSVLRQEGGVKIEGSEFRYAEHRFRHKSECHHHEKVRFPAPEFFQEGFILEGNRLEQRQVVGTRIFLDCAAAYLHPPSAGLVHGSHHSHHVIPLLHKSVEGCHREFRRTHKHNTSLFEQSHKFGFDFSEFCFYVVCIEKGSIVNGFPGEPDAYRPQHNAGYEYAQLRRHGPVPCKFLSGNVYNPIEYEEEHGDDCRCSESTFVY